MDGLTGFADAVKAVFPDTHIQYCIVHLIRSCTKFVSYKDLKGRINLVSVKPYIELCLIRYLCYTAGVDFIWKLPIGATPLAALVLLVYVMLSVYF